MAYRVQVAVSTPLHPFSMPLLTTPEPQKLVDDFHKVAIDLLESEWLKLNDTADDLDCASLRFLDPRFLY